MIGEACGEVGKSVEVLVWGLKGVIFSVDMVLLAELVTGGLGGMMTSSVLFLGLPGEGVSDRDRPIPIYRYRLENIQTVTDIPQISQTEPIPGTDISV